MRATLMALILLFAACSAAQPETGIDCEPMSVALSGGQGATCRNVAPLCPPVICVDETGTPVCNGAMAQCPPIGTTPVYIISAGGTPDWVPERLTDGGYNYECMAPVCGHPGCPTEPRLPLDHGGHPCGECLYKLTPHSYPLPDPVDCLCPCGNPNACNPTDGGTGTCP